MDTYFIRVIRVKASFTDLHKIWLETPRGAVVLLASGVPYSAVKTIVTAVREALHEVNPDIKIESI